MAVRFENFTEEEKTVIDALNKAINGQQVIMNSLQGELDRTFAAVLIRLKLSESVRGIKRKIKFDLVKHLVVIEETPEIITS